MFIYINHLLPIFSTHITPPLQIYILIFFYHSGSKCLYPNREAILGSLFFVPDILLLYSVSLLPFVNFFVNTFPSMLTMS